MSLPAAPPDRVRVDVWLDVACLCKTRSEAQRACQGGKVEVNGQRAKPHREVKVGDDLVLTRGMGRRQHVRVTGLADVHIPRAAARLLYEDTTPPPSPQELEARRLDALARPTRLAAGRPDTRQRRALRRLKRGDE